MIGGAGGQAAIPSPRRMTIVRAWCLASLLAVSSPASAQSIDAAIEVKEGAAATLRADMEVGLVTGLTGELQDETWYVAGACSNRPSVSVAFNIGLSASLEERTVGLSRSRLTADKVICITNTDNLSDEMLEVLGLEQ
ncbi:hypothetical protein GCM10023325_08630 [Sphingomonas lutea]